MSTTPARRRRRIAAVLVAAALVGVVALAGCADDDSPADAVPALAEQLQTIDAAIDGGDLAQARAALEGLIAETDRAHAAGELTAEQADAILAAARQLLDRLPVPTTTAPPTTAAESGPPDKDEKNDKDDGEDDDDEKDNGNGKGNGNGRGD